GFSIEKVIFQSQPEVYVTANLYLPARLSGPTGAVVFACGHGETAKAHPTYQAVCQRLARNGLVALAFDPSGQGERKSYLEGDGREQVRWGTVEHMYAGYQCWQLGHSLVRYFVHDAQRALDYLAARPEVDPARIGMTGSSGGGTQTAWMMLLEPRLAAAAPATFITSRRAYMWTGQAQDAEQHLPGGTVAGIDHEDSLIAMAPRPVLALAVNYDFFNIEGTVRSVERARRIYRLLGAEANVDLVRVDSTHQYHPVLARAATAFFVQHLLQRDPASLDDRDPAPFDPAVLRCTESGQVLLDRSQTRRVFDLNLSEYQARPAPSAGTVARPERARDWLQMVVQRDRRPAAEFFPRWLPAPPEEDVTVHHGFWWSEQDVLNAGVLLRPADRAYDTLLIALFDQGTTDLEQWRAWCRERVRRGQAVLALDVRGTGALTPREVVTAPSREHNTMYKLATDLLWLNDSLPAMAVYDVLQAVAFAGSDSEIQLARRPVHLFGAGRGAFRAYLAAALAPWIARVDLECAGTPLDPTGLIGERLYTPTYPQQALPDYLLPGMFGQFDWPDLEPLLAGRVQSIAGL
ncbi:MAG TPA: acetylxylan esterase, partial [Chloroflexota bacterium]|nr:acetylxylan esterase [Chloroflexota bacterium]